MGAFVMRWEAALSLALLLGGGFGAGRKRHGFGGWCWSRKPLRRPPPRPRRPPLLGKREKTLLQ